MNASCHVKHASHHPTRVGFEIEFLLSPEYFDTLSPLESEGIFSVKGSVKTSVISSGTTLTTTQSTTQKIPIAGHIHFIGPDFGGRWEIIK